MVYRTGLYHVYNISMNYTGFSAQKMAELVGQTHEHVWEVVSRFTHHLDKLQQKDETITSAASPDPEVTSEQYWRKVANNLINLAQCSIASKRLGS